MRGDSIGRSNSSSYNSAALGEGDILRRSTADIRHEGAFAKAQIDIDGTGKVDLYTGSAFLDHMLHSFAKTSGLDITVKAGGSALMTPAAIGRAIGSAINNALGERIGIRRYAWASVPMDESLAKVALDISGRPYLIMNGKFSNDRIGDLNTLQIRVVIESIVNCARLTVNVWFDGENDHHKAESIFKAFGLALKDAVLVEGGDVPSTKGII